MGDSDERTDENEAPASAPPLTASKASRTANLLPLSRSVSLQGMPMDQQSDADDDSAAVSVSDMSIARRMSRKRLESQSCADDTPIREPSRFVEEKMLEHSSPGVGEAFGGKPSGREMEKVQEQFAAMFVDELREQIEAESQHDYIRTTKFGFLDMAPSLRYAAECIVQDSFTCCFTSAPMERWNFNIYLFPLYYLGVAVRYLILFPLRLLGLLVGVLVFAIAMVVSVFMPPSNRVALQRRSITWLAFAFAFAFTAVIRYHGAFPRKGGKYIYVSNHTSLIDTVVLMQHRPFALVGQAHQGFIGWCQKYLLGSMNNLWFERFETKDRKVVAERIEEHIGDASNPPLVVFPEGTCVNNEYVVMFKKGAFELDASVVPIAIKYNKIFVDAFWNSRKQTFPEHLFRLMTAWAVVCDVWVCEPTSIGEDETPTEFANRVQQIIADRAKITAVPWDGYLKYMKPNKRELEARQRVFADLLRVRFNLPPNTTTTTAVAATAPSSTVSDSVSSSSAPLSSSSSNVRQRKINSDAKRIPTTQ